MIDAGIPIVPLERNGTDISDFRFFELDSDAQAIGRKIDNVLESTAIRHFAIHILTGHWPPMPKSHWLI